MNPALLLLAVLAVEPASLSEQLEALAAHNVTGHRDAARAELQAFARAHPGTDEAGAALLLLGQSWRQDGGEEAARDAFHQVLITAPGSPAALEARRALADLALARGDYDEAEAAYALLLQSGTERHRYQARLGLGLSDSQRQRARFMWAVAVALVAVGAWQGVRAARARRLWPMPAEVSLTGPLFVLLALAALSQPAAEARAVLVVAAGGWALVWLNGAGWSAAPPRGVWRGVAVVLGLGQAAGLLSCAVMAGGLWTRFMETLSVGPE